MNFKNGSIRLIWPWKQVFICSHIMVDLMLSMEGEDANTLTNELSVRVILPYEVIYICKPFY